MPRPDFFIVGAPRSGTTALYKYLRQHPDIFMASPKEPGYFGVDLEKRPPVLDEGGYLRIFAGARTERRIGEATVWYLYSESAPSEIRRFTPDARIIIMLRNPVDMIDSLHSHFLATANEDIGDLGEALDAEDDRRAGRLVPTTAHRPEGLRYRWVGRYSPHVARWLRTFGAERVHVIIFDDFSADPARVYRQTLEFLGVDPGFTPRFPVVNRHRVARSVAAQRIMYSPIVARTLSRLPLRAHDLLWLTVDRANSRYAERPPMDVSLRRRLQRDLAEDVAALSQLLARDLRHWTAGAL